jgi:hypothetical protein
VLCNIETDKTTLDFESLEDGNVLANVLSPHSHEYATGVSSRHVGKCPSKSDLLHVC